MLATLRTNPMAFLRNALRANAVFSTLSGIGMIIGGTQLAAWLGKPGSIVADGVVLLVFAGILVWITRHEVVSLKVASVVIALDLLFVADTTSKILGGTFTTAGSWFYGIVAMIVLDLALLQALGAIRSNRTNQQQAGATGATTL